jgi:hypothetical protein
MNLTYVSKMAMSLKEGMAKYLNLALRGPGVRGASEYLVIQAKCMWAMTANTTAFSLG